MCKYKAEILINGQNKIIRGYVKSASVLEGYSKLIQIFKGCMWNIRDIVLLDY